MCIYKAIDAFFKIEIFSMRSIRLSTVLGYYNTVALLIVN